MRVPPPGQQRVSNAAAPPFSAAAPLPAYVALPHALPLLPRGLAPCRVA